MTLPHKLRPTSQLWTDEAVSRMKELWASNELSASEIARALGPGHTRNTVLGKAMRLKLESHAGIKTDAAIQRRAHSIVRPTAKPRPIPPSIEPPYIGPVATSAGPDVCQFIKGDPLRDSDWRMCGQPGFPWCPYHTSIVWQPKHQNVRDYRRTTQGLAA